MNKDYRTVREIVGPLVFLDEAEGVKYGELVELRTVSGPRHGQVLEVSGNTVLVQLFEGSSGMDRGRTVTRFLGHGLEFGVSRDIVGRVFNGLGTPTDGVPPVIPDKVVDINGNPMNPYSRDYPDEFIQTGVSASMASIPLCAARSFQSSQGAACRMLRLPPRSQGRRACSPAAMSLRSCSPPWVLPSKRQTTSFLTSEGAVPSISPCCS